MCGITGFINFDLSNSIEIELDRAIKSLSHRGPDSSGKKVFSKKFHIGFGHRRLSILDTSSAGHQPMDSHSGRYTICFNGEIYNHIQLREYILKNFSFNQWRSSSDTETLVNLISFVGVEQSLKMIHGMFAFAMYDQFEHKVFFARDRLGEKPLYFSSSDKTILFGSELKALRCFSRHHNTISNEALYAYTQLNYIPTPQSIYKRTFKCPQGTFISIDLNKFDYSTLTDNFEEFISLQGVNHSSYWELSAPSKVSLDSYENTRDNFEAILENSISKQMIADVPLGAFLSGGVDSSLIVALMQKISSNPIETFTIGFENKRYDESIHALKVAQHLNTNHHELIVSDQDALDTLPLLSDMYDEPFADSSQIPTFLVSKLARSQVTVSLSGDGGDELFGGYNRYLLSAQLWNFIKFVPFNIRKLFSYFALPIVAKLIGAIEDSNYLQNVLSTKQSSEKIMKLSSRLTNVKSAKDLYISLVTQYGKSNGLVKNDYFQDLEILNPVIWNNNSLSFEEKMMMIDSKTYLPDDILCKVDRAAMATSLESRVPFLDIDVIEASLQMHQNFKIRNGQSKYILRDILYKYVPKNLIERPKQGFGIPLGDWINGPLNEKFQDLLSDQSFEHNLFDKAFAQNMLKEHNSGRRNWEHQLWSIFIFQDWITKNHG